MRNALFLALACSVAACDSDPGFPADSTTDVDPDVGGGSFDVSNDAEPTDTTADVIADTCAARTPLDAPFALAADGPTTQINLSAARQDDAIWLTYNTRGETDAFDVWLTRIDCTGANTLPPIRANAVAGPTAIEPQIAVSDESVLLVWQTDTSGLEHNLDIVARAFDLNGVPLEDSEHTIEMQRNGAPNSGNTWMPALRADNDGGFVLAGSWGHDDAPAFQVFSQQLSAAGEPIGDAADARVDAASGQHYPALATGPQGSLIAWANSPLEGDEFTWATRLGGDAPFEPVQLPFNMTGTPGAAQTPELALVGASSAGARGNVDIAIVAVGADGPDATRTALTGDASRADHTPSLAIQDPTTAAVVYYRTISGFQSDVIAARIDVSDTGLTAGEDVPLLTDGPAAPYTPVLISLGDGVWFAAWSDGPSPEFAIRGQFFSL